MLHKKYKKVGVFPVPVVSILTMATASTATSTEEFLEKGCDCKLGNGGTQCITNFSREQFEQCRYSFMELSNDEKDLFILSFLTLSRMPGDDIDRHYSTFTMYGKKVCRKTFLFLLNISKNKYSNICKHYSNNGLVSRSHGNKGRLPSNSHSFETKKHVKSFIETYAEDHGVLLPGRIPGYRDQSISLLSSAESKKNVWEFYQESCNDGDLRPVCYSLFLELWEELIPWVVIAKPATDLCWECQQNNNKIFKNANRSEEEKMITLGDQMKHLDNANAEREYYKSQCAQAKEDLSSNFPDFSPFEQYQPCSFIGTAHISWDYAQQLHYPSDPFQPGPLYFKTSRKCALFGICNDAVNHQINYLVDEIVSTGKGANSTISYVHHYLQNHGMGETKLLIHADNCVGKSKLKEKQTKFIDIPLKHTHFYKQLRCLTLRF